MLLKQLKHYSEQLAGPGDHTQIVTGEAINAVPSVRQPGATQAESLEKSSLWLNVFFRSFSHQNQLGSHGTILQRCGGLLATAALILLTASSVGAADFVFVVDTSGSMVEPISKRDGRVRITTVQEALRNYLSVLPADSRLSLISFNSGISSEKEVILRSDAERQAVVRWVNGLEAEARRNGDTHLWSTLRRALQIASEYSKQTAEQTVMVRVLTDGQDTERRLTLDQVLAEFPNVDGKAIRANLVLLGDLEIPLRIARNGFQIVRDTRWEMVFPPILQWSPTPVRVNQEVSFFDNSRSAYQFYEWRVDGAQLSQQKALTHRFTSSGEHTVNLVVSGIGGSKDSATVRLTVLEGEKPEPLVPDFVFAPASPEPGQRVQFIGRCTGKPTAFSWQVEGREATNTMDAEFAFPREGTFGVKFVVRDAAGNSAEKAQTVSVVEPKVIVAFEASPQIYSGQATRFVNTTEGRVSSFEWDFGDGSTNAERNPTHTYQNDGNSEKNFTVILHARTALGKMLQSKPAMMRVLPTVKAPAPVAAFRILGEQFKVGTRVEFVDESTGLVSTYAWNFNGEATSMEKNPAFGFETPGNKAVQLKVRGPDGGESVAAKTLTVQQREQSIDAHWLDQRGQNCVPPKEIHFDEVAIQHVKNGQYPRPQFTTFEIILPPDLPPGGGAGLTIEGKAASAFELVRLVPGSDNVAPMALSGLITDSGRFRVDIRPETGEGEYTGEIVIRAQGQNVLVNKLAKPLSVAVVIKVASPGGGGVFLLFLLLAAAAFLVWWFVIRGGGIPPGQLMVVNLTELAGAVKDNQNAPLARGTFELRMAENISLGRDGKEDKSAKVFDLGVPAQYLMRQQKGLQLRHRDGGKPKLLRLSDQFSVTDTSGKKRQAKVTATAKPKHKPTPPPAKK